MYALIETENGICTSLKSDLYFRSHLPLSTKLALLNFRYVGNLVPIRWKMCWPRAQNSENPNPHTSKIGYLLPVYGFRNTRRRIQCPSHFWSACKIWRNRNDKRVTDVIVQRCTNRNRIRNLHISKIRFLFPVSFTIEYKVGIAEFYLYGIWCWYVEKCGHQGPKTIPKSESAHL